MKDLKNLCEKESERRRFGVTDVASLLGALGFIYALAITQTLYTLL